MSNERDELAELILDNFYPDATGGSSWRLNPTSAADDILAAGYRKPKIITTQAELDALVEGTAIKDEADLLEKEDGRWFYGDDSNVEVSLPAIVLWEPEA